MNGLADGDAAVVAEIGGQRSQDNVFIAIRRWDKTGGRTVRGPL